MRVAITGGTGFVGRHLARGLVGRGHQTVLVARGKDVPDGQVGSDKTPFRMSLRTALASTGKSARTPYLRVHVRGTKHVVEAARLADVGRIVLLSFLRARPNCGSAYHESNGPTEEIVRSSCLSYTIFKAGVICGRGDHMLDHISHALYTFPIFGLVGMKEKPIRPVAVEDPVAAIIALFHLARLLNTTVSITGPEEIALSEAVRRVGEVIGKHPLYVPTPLAIQTVIAKVAERTMKIPLLSLAQLRILSEGIAEALPACDTLPADLLPATRFAAEQIHNGLPQPGPFGLRDLGCCTA